MNNNIPTGYVSKNDEKYSKLFWKSVPKDEREKMKERMINNIHYGCEEGSMFAFLGHLNLLGDYVKHHKFTNQDQYACSAYRVLAKEISDEKTKYLAGRFDFNKKKGVMRAPMHKVSLEEKVE